jgi:hypothetical protein
MATNQALSFVVLHRCARTGMSQGSGVIQKIAGWRAVLSVERRRYQTPFSVPTTHTHTHTYKHTHTHTHLQTHTHTH